MISKLVIRSSDIQMTRLALQVASIFEQKMQEEFALCLRDWRPLTSLERAFPYVVERLDRESKELAEEIIQHNMETAQAMTSDEEWMTDLVRESLEEAGISTAPVEPALRRVVKELGKQAKDRRTFEQTRGKLYTAERGSFGTVGRGKVPFRFPILFQNLLGRALEFVALLATQTEAKRRPAA